MGEYSTSASDRHLAEHEKLVHWVVRRQWLGTLSYSEALQAGRMGLWHALQRYDPGRGIAFSTYAVPAIRRAVWRAVDQAQPRSGTSLPLSTRPVTHSSAPDSDPALHDAFPRRLVCEALYEMVRQLPDRLGYVLIAHYGLAGDPPRTFAAIGQVLNITRQRVQQLHTEALLWLAHPAHSLRLRVLLDRTSTSDYQRYLARLRAWQRAHRRNR